MPSQSIDELKQIAHQCFERGDFQGSIYWNEQIELLARQQNNLVHELDAIESQAVSWSNLGKPQRAIESSTRLINLARRNGQKLFLMNGTRLFASRAADIDLRNRWSEIRSILLEGVETARQLKDDYGEVYHLMRLGSYAIDVKEIETGYSWLQDALNKINPDWNSKDFLYNCIYESISGLMRQRENYEEAIHYAEMAIAAAERDGNPLFICGAHLTLAESKYEASNFGTALNIIEAELPKARKYNWQGQEQWAEYLRAEIERKLDNPGKAVTAARRALELARAMSYKEGEVKCLISLGQARLAWGSQPMAIRVLCQAQELSQERNYQDHLSKVNEVLAGLS